MPEAVKSINERNALSTAPYHSFKADVRSVLYATQLTASHPCPPPTPTPPRHRSQTPSSSGNVADAALRFEDIHRRIRLLGCIKNRASVLHLLHALAGTGTAEKQQGMGAAQMPSRVFAEPLAGLSGIDRVGHAQTAPAVSAGATYGYGQANGRVREEGGYEAVGVRRRMRRVRSMNEVTERTLLRGILYAFQVNRRSSP